MLGTIVALVGPLAGQTFQPGEYNVLNCGCLYIPAGPNTYALLGEGEYEQVDPEPEVA